MKLRYGKSILTLFSAILEEVVKELIEPVGYDGSDYEGWFCVSIRPCICLSCGASVCFVEPIYYHVIVVWEEKDDEKLLRIAAKYKVDGFDPRIVTYNPIMGACIPFDEVAKLNG